MSGIIYIAIGRDYLQQALHSARSVIENYEGNCPDIIIYTDIKSDSLLLFSPTRVHIRSIPVWIDDISSPVSLSGYFKTQLNYLSPFDKTLFLDTDIRAVADISCIWSFCDKSIALAKAFNPLSEIAVYDKDSEEHYTQNLLSISGDFTQYNTGVILFDKCDKVDTVFRDWGREWLIFKNNDNKAFNRLIAKGLEIDYLLSIYNDFYPDRSHKSVLIHYISWYKKYL